MLALTLLAAVGAYALSRRPRPRPFGPCELFRGVTYECRKLPESPEGSGLVHVVRVDLVAPGIELFVTPLDEQAVEEGYQYRLDYASRAAERENLALAVNAAMFEADSSWFPRAGDFARGHETLVADGVVSHVHEHSYLLWFDRQLGAHLEREKPPGPRALAEAAWGIGSQGIVVADGKVSSLSGREPDHRTLLGIDRDQGYLWIAVFEHASHHLAGRTLVELGAKEAVMLDGGDSTQLYLAESRTDAPHGTLLGGHRPVATFFGVRAATLQAETSPSP